MGSTHDELQSRDRRRMAAPDAAASVHQGLGCRHWAAVKRRVPGSCARQKPDLSGILVHHGQPATYHGW